MRKMPGYNNGVMRHINPYILPSLVFFRPNATLAYMNQDKNRVLVSNQVCITCIVCISCITCVRCIVMFPGAYNGGILWGLPPFPNGSLDYALDHHYKL